MVRTTLLSVDRVGSGDSLEVAMSTEPVMPESGSLELPVEELLRRVRPLPSHEEMVIGDLDDDEGAAFLAVLKG